jgi:thiamine biosynthesis lipoprotein
MRWTTTTGTSSTIRVRIVLALVLAAALLACRPPSFDLDPRVELVGVSDGWLAMGTFFDADLRVPPDRADDARVWLDEQRGGLSRLEAIYSRHDDASELSRVNRVLAAPAVLRDGARISAELESILYAALEVWEGSAGAFDPTIGPLVDVWTRAAHTSAFPPLGDLRQVRRRVGAHSLLLPGDGELGVTLEDIRLDLDGLSKGVALDALAADFRETFPGASALLSFGESSVFAIGDPDGRLRGGGWRLEVRSRDERGTRLSTIRLRDLALSVSSSVGKTSKIGDYRISHVIDPRTGVAVDGTVEAVVVSQRAGIADGWSTALLVLGAQREALRLLDRAELEAYVFERAGRIAATEGWEALEVETAPAVEAPRPESDGRGIVPVDRAD